MAHSRGYIISGSNEIRERVGVARQKFFEAFKRLEDLSVSSGAQRLLNQIIKLEADHHASLQKLLSLKDRGAKPKSMALVFEQDLLPKRLALEAAVDRLVAFEKDRFESKRDESVLRARLALIFVSVTLFVAGILSFRSSLEVLRSYINLAKSEEENRKGLIREQYANRRFLDLVNHLDHSVIWEARSDASDFGLKFSFVSDRLQFLLGLPPQEILDDANVFFNHVVSEDRSLLQDMFRRGLEQKRDIRCDHRMMSVDGKEVWVQTGIHVRRTTSGEDIIFGITMDVSPLKLMEKKEKEERQRYDLALNAAGIGVFDLELTSNRIHWTQREARLFGFFDLNVRLEDVFARIYPSDREEVQSKLNDAVTLKKDYRAEFRVMLPDGQLRWLLGVGRALVDDKGNPVKIIGVNQDITDRREINDRLRAAVDELDRYKKALDSISIVVKTDQKGVIKYVNDKFCEISKYSREELIGKTHKVVNSGFHSREFFSEMWQSISQGRIWTGDIQNRAKDGTPYWVQTFIVPFLDAKGSIQEYVTIRNDITARKRTEQELARHQEELQKAKIAAESASFAKTTFLANMSHEIRTPIGVIQGFSDLLVESERLDPELLRWAKTIQKNSRQLVALVGEILDLSKIELSELQIERSDFDLSATVNDVRSAMEFKAQERGIALRFVIHSDVPKMIRSDPTRVTQILLNLIGNAIKFTEKGYVLVNLFSVTSNEGELLLKVLVRDTGVGMTQAQQRQVFEPFVQADSSITRRFGGTGLGLAISRRFAEALGGSLVIVESIINKGTTFELTLPYLPPAEGEQLQSGAWREAGSVLLESAARLDAKRVLLVEDSQDNQALISRFLSQANVQLELAENGREGVRKALAESFDLILMDLQMPEMDGYEAVRLIRDAGLKLPIFAITAQALSGDRERVLKNGFDKYLSKPIDKEVLLSALMEVISPHPLKQ